LGWKWRRGHAEIEGSCKHIEKADKDSQKDVVLQFGGGQHANNSSPENLTCYETMDLAIFFVQLTRGGLPA